MSVWPRPLLIFCWTDVQTSRGGDLDVLLDYLNTPRLEVTQWCQIPPDFLVKIRIPGLSHQTSGYFSKHLSYLPSPLALSLNPDLHWGLQVSTCCSGFSVTSLMPCHCTLGVILVDPPLLPVVHEFQSFSDCGKLHRDGSDTPPVCKHNKVI